MKLFIAAIGKHTLISEIKPTHFDQFRNARFDAMKRLYQQRGWIWNEDKVKRGVNKDIENIRTVLRMAVKKCLMPAQYLPKIEKLKVDRRRLPSFLNKQEINRMAAQLEGEALLAFWVLRYSAARRGEIARKFVGDERGLKWKHIDWASNRIRFYGKKKERLVPMHPKLREMLSARKNELGLSAHDEAHVISLVRDTLSDYFSKARLKAGITKPGAVHILRHSAATTMLESGANIREVQDFLGHSTIAVTEIYTHVVQEKLESAVLRAFE